MTKKSKNLGNKGEKEAIDYLLNKDYKIIDTNYKTKIGEIDIIAGNDDYIILIEVKTKSDSSYGLAKEMVNRKKQQKLIKLAKQLEIEYPDKIIRIDVIAIDKNTNSIDHIKNAVEDNI